MTIYNTMGKQIILDKLVSTRKFKNVPKEVISRQRIGKLRELATEEEKNDFLFKIIKDVIKGRIENSVERNLIHNPEFYDETYFNHSQKIKPSDISESGLRKLTVCQIAVNKELWHIHRHKKVSKSEVGNSLELGINYSIDDLFEILKEIEQEIINEVELLNISSTERATYCHLTD